jgi:hypothetical protein
MGGACSPNGGEKKIVYVIGAKAGGKEFSRKDKTQVGG